MNPLRINFKDNGCPTRGRASLLYEGGQPIHVGDVDLVDRPSREKFCDEACRALHNPGARPLIDGFLEGELIRTERLAPMSAAKLVKRYPKLREPIIDGALRAGEVMNLNSAAKSGKTWLAKGAGLCIAAGLPVVGKFQTRAVPVLYVDNELHFESISFRLSRIAAALGVDLERLGDNFQVLSLRGRLRDVHALKGEFARLGNRPGVIFLDALYRAQPEGFNENDNANTAQLYNIIDGYATELGAAFVLVHHQSRGLQNMKAVTDVGAGAGAQPRAADTHMAMRQHDQDDAYVVESVARSWPPMDAFCLRWEFPLWKLAPDLDPTQLREANRQRANRGWTPERFVGEFIKADPRRQTSILADAKAAQLSERGAKDLLAAAESNGLAFRWKGKKATDPVCWATVNQSVLEAL